MPDRIEREIEELLAKLDTELPDGGREPISIEQRRRRQRSLRRRLPRPSLPELEPATLLLSGAGIMIAGLFLAMLWDRLIWVSFTGVLVFIAAFLLSFRKRPIGTAGGGPKRVYWRDRYIEYGSEGRGRFRNPFRRR